MAIAADVGADVVAGAAVASRVSGVPKVRANVVTTKLVITKAVRTKPLRRALPTTLPMKKALRSRPVATTGLTDRNPRVAKASVVAAGAVVVAAAAGDARTRKGLPPPSPTKSKERSNPR